MGGDEQIKMILVKVRGEADQCAEAESKIDFSKSSIWEEGWKYVHHGEENVSQSTGVEVMEVSKNRTDRSVRTVSKLPLHVQGKHTNCSNKYTKPHANPIHAEKAATVGSVTSSTTKRIDP